ncbi:MAG: hypothetical protein Q7S33_05305 [Nanoarchaeota archaeon]|nr:hypothetical protein [Nanoarchaeota archaeon]
MPIKVWVAHCFSDFKNDNPEEIKMLIRYSGEKTPQEVLIKDHYEDIPLAQSSPKSTDTEDEVYGGEGRDSIFYRH